MSELTPCKIAGIEGLYYKAEDVEAEIARLKGEVERWMGNCETIAIDRRIYKDRAETAEAEAERLQKVCSGLVRTNTSLLSKLRTADARGKELEAEVDIAVGRALKRNYAVMDGQLATAEARVRELEELITAEANATNLGAINLDYATKATIAQAEAERLKGEVERLQSLADMLEVTLKRKYDTTAKLIKDIEFSEDRAETAETEMKRWKGEAELWALRTNDWNQRANEAEARVMELEARVRPGVGDIGLELAKVCKTTVTTDATCRTLCYANISEMAQAIHDILPPAPKMLTVEEMMKLGVETLDSWKGNVIDLRLTCEAIHKAMGGGE